MNGRQGQGQGESVTSPRRLTAAERRDRAFALRKRKWTYAAIGEDIGVTRQQAHKLVRQALAELPPLPEIMEFRRLELETSDDLIAAMWGKVEAQDPEAVRAVARVLEYRARLTGSYVSPSLNSVGMDAVQGVLDQIVGMAVRLLAEDQRPAFLADVERSLLQIEAPKET